MNPLSLGSNPSGVTKTNLNNMEVKFKRLSDKAVAPVRAHKEDAGLDLTCSRITTELNECGQLLLVYHTDLALEIPDGYFGMVVPRSSIYKKSLRQTNSVGVIDSNYRGEVIVKFATTTDVVPAVFKEGERFAQLLILPVPDVNFTEAEELSKTDRGDGSFGSTGAKAVEETTSDEKKDNQAETAA